MKIVAAQGFKAFSFWNTTEEEQDAIVNQVLDEIGINLDESVSPCSSAVGLLYYITDLNRPVILSIL